MKINKDHKVVRLIPKLIPYVFYGLFFIFLFVYLKSINYEEFKSASFVWYYLLISGILALFTRFFQAYIWVSLLKGLGATGLQGKWRPFLFVYAKSWLGRYIPGTAPWLLGKIYFASKHGVSKNKLAISSLLEGGLQVTVTMAVALVMLFSDSRFEVVDPQFKIILVGLLLACIITLIPPVFNKVISIIYKLIKKEPLASEHLVDAKTLFRGIAQYTFGAVISGFSLFFIAKAIYPELAYSNMIFVMGVGNLASAASMLAFFAPSGLGVRESIQLTLLSVIMPTELALIVTVTTRLWGVVMDFIFFGIAKLLNRSPVEEAEEVPNSSGG